MHVKMFLILAVIIGLVGCKVTGGGHIPSVYDPSKKATMDFYMDCEESPADDLTLVSIFGELNYKDYVRSDGIANAVPAGLIVSIHGVVDDTAELAGVSQCDEPPALPIAFFQGNYTPQPRTLGQGGRFLLSVIDNGEPGAPAFDNMEIQLAGGVFNGYSNGGAIGGGNYKVE